ncbi:T9SS type A sorting domain-containing protein [uncultured Pontibacter sp.]|uniref:Ig-like domain-containing protein n=1 Tax=uncultured Pontibacter sp. TaxID=453356 RepID=UPI002633B496|nr:T9SS type A sorting domain-containing protein [uncultured Pontibacter sp.]
MKHIYTSTLTSNTLKANISFRLVLVISFILLTTINGYGQKITSISPSCVVAGGGSFILTVVGDDFNGSSYVTLNGVMATNYTRSDNTFSVIVPAASIANAGVIEVQTTRANKFSPTSINLVVVGTPTATSIASCGQATLSAFGAPAGAVYQWYSQATGGIAIATGATYTTASAGQYYVSTAVPGSCESPRRLVTATINAMPTSPKVTNRSRCGVGSLVLSASGAVSGQGYRWYTASTGGTSVATGQDYTTSSLSVGIKTYYVSIVTNATGCESARVPITATVRPIQFGNTEFVRQTLEVGKPGTIKLNSEVIDSGHAISITWQSVKNGEPTILGITEAPASSPATFDISSVPGADTYFRAIITPISSVCYDESSLDVTSQEIVSLPVELVSFKAQSTKDGVQLSWKTASELDNKGFEVEVSADGKNFRKIAFIESKVGTTSLVQNYSYLDTRAAAGINYYRLKQVDFDGAFEYSKVVAVNNAAVASSTVYPTLASHEVTVRLAASDEQVMISVADMTGKQLLAIQNPSERQVVLPVQHLQNGIYFVTVTTGAQKEVIRFMKR